MPSDASAQPAAHAQHHMLTEIFEQPAAIRATLDAYTADGDLRPDLWQPLLDALGDPAHLVIAASGTSRHAGLVAEILLEEIAGLAVDVEYASEYILQSPQANTGAAVLVISQSGETADTLAALAEARRRGARTLSITNVAGSSMATLADATLQTFAGPERAIAATKSFTTQLIVLSLLTLALARRRGRLSPEQTRDQVGLLARLPDQIEGALPGWKSSSEAAAKSFADASSFLFLGRGLAYPIAREAALKLKEVSYLPAEAYPSGELKHGPNALIAEGAPLVIVTAADPSNASSVARHRKSLRLLEDIQAQHPHLLAVASDGDGEIGSLADEVLRIPTATEYLLPILEIIPLQLFAYWMALERGLDVDRPRNLVKSVSVE